MALADTAKLIASLELQDKFSATANKAVVGLRNLEGTSGRTTGSMGKLSTAAGQTGRAMGFLGHTVSTALGVGLSQAVSAGIGLLKSSISEGIAGAQELEDVMVATNTVLKSTKDASGQTAEGIRNLASQFENMNALIDDKVIQSAENMLATFTKIGPEAFKPATQAILDMNTAMGGGPEGLQGVAIQVGKALNDPIKGVTALRKVGVSLTDQQTEQIAKLVEQNDLYGAQTIILDELATEFGGRFAAQGKTGAATMAAVADSVDDLKIAFAQGLLPGLQVAGKALSETFRDPATIAAITSFGQKIGSFLTADNIHSGIGAIKTGFEQIVGFAKQVPWDTIGTSLKLAGQGARTLFNAFTSLPPWIQTAVITGWGLNKLTGGFLGNIVGSLASGLIKGILGINAGVVNVNAATVAGAPVAGAAQAAGGGLLGTVGAFAAKFVLGPAAAVIIGSEIAAAVNEATIGPARQFEEGGFKAVVDSKDVATLVNSLNAIERAQHDPDLLHQTTLIASNIPFIGDALGHVGTTLDDQRQALLAQLTEMGLTREQAEKIAAASEAQAKLAQEAGARQNATDNALISEAKASRLASTSTAADMKKLTLEQKLIQDNTFKQHLDAQEFIKILKQTSEFGAKGKGTTIEQGPRTGRDPFGQAFVHLVSRLEKPALQSVVVQGEIRRHITAAEQVQRQELKQGDVHAARLLQSTIDTLHRILGTEDRHNALLDRNDRTQQTNGREARQSAIETMTHLRLMESLERRTGDNTAAVASKDFTPRVAVNVNSRTTVSVNDVVRSVSAYDYAVNTYGGGKVGNLSNLTSP
jgi:hypothetical protein